MKLFKSFFFVAVLMGFSVESAMAGFKRISISQTNNSPYFMTDGKWVSDQSLTASDLQQLKEYVQSKGFKPGEQTELGLITTSLKWVNEQWDHDGMNQPPPQFHALDILKRVHQEKKQYRCVEYGIVLAEILQAYGFSTRTVGLRSSEVAYGGFGHGHVAMEVWVNELGKWIFLDPQFGSYITTKDSQTPLSYYEIYKEKMDNRWAALDVHFVSMKGQLKNLVSDYKNFLKNYFGHMRVSAGEDQPGIGLLLEAKEMPLTFQAGVLNDVVYTKDSSLVYPELNRVTLLLSYKESPMNFQQKLQDLKIKTEEDYLNSMGQFAVKPDFQVKLKSSMMNLKGYEYRLGRTGAWLDVKDADFSWNATNPENYLEVRAINSFGRRGPVTFMEIKYQ